MATIGKRDWFDSGENLNKRMSKMELFLTLLIILLSSVVRQCNRYSGKSGIMDERNPIKQPRSFSLTVPTRWARKIFFKKAS